MAQPIDLYYWPTPNGHKVTIAAEEMELPYRLVPVNIGVGEQFAPEFLAISPNNRMPAMVDPDGPGGTPISVFESGAILQYLARKSGRFGGKDAREQAEVEQWLFWQMGGLGPMAGQAHHFRAYAPAMIADQRQVAYGAIRYTNEVHRLYGVMDKRLADRDYLAGDYSIADMASYPWTISWRTQGIVREEFPHLHAWQDRMAARPKVRAALDLADMVRAGAALSDSGPEAEARRKLLFGQRAR
jgi:GST-like protein